MLLRSLLLAGLLSVLLVAPSAAVVDPRFHEPQDGAVVGSRPVFVVDGETRGGSIDVEIARDPTLRTEGERAGAFVERFDSMLEFFGGDPTLPDNAARWDSGRIPAGDWFWHAKVDLYDSDDETWSATRRFTVADEPLILAGWTARLRRAKPVRGCAKRWRLGGVIETEDNDASPRVDWVARVFAGSRQMARLGDRSEGGSASLRGAFCSRATSHTVRLTVRDRGGHRVDASRVVGPPSP